MGKRLYGGLNSFYFFLQIILLVYRSYLIWDYSYPTPHTIISFDNSAIGETFIKKNMRNNRKSHPFFWYDLFHCRILMEILLPRGPWSIFYIFFFFLLATNHNSDDFFDWYPPIYYYYKLAVNEKRIHYGKIEIWYFNHRFRTIR